MSHCLPSASMLTHTSHVIAMKFLGNLTTGLALFPNQNLLNSYYASMTVSNGERSVHNKTGCSLTSRSLCFRGG